MDKIKDVIAAHSKDNKITCASALKIAEEFKESPEKIGKILDDLKIKVIECQLGCFGKKKDR